MIDNCMFQYGTRHTMLADTDLISEDKAIGLFNKNKEDFKNRLQNDESPEMAIWVNCVTSENYGDTLYHWRADNFKVLDNELYQRVC